MVAVPTAAVATALTATTLSAASLPAAIAAALEATALGPGLRSGLERLRVARRIAALEAGGRTLTSTAEEAAGVGIGVAALGRSSVRSRSVRLHKSRSAAAVGEVAARAPEEPTAAWGVTASAVIVLLRFSTLVRRREILTAIAIGKAASLKSGLRANACVVLRRRREILAAATIGEATSLEATAEAIGVRAVRIAASESVAAVGAAALEIAAIEITADE